MHEKIGKSRFIYFVFPLVCGSGRSKRRLAQAAGAEPCGQISDEKLHAVAARNTSSPSEKTKKTHIRNTCGSGEVETLHAVVARITYPSKCAKHTILGPLLEVQMLFCVASAGDCAPCQESAKQPSPHYTHYNYIQNDNYITLHYVIYCIALHSTPLHYTTRQPMTLHYTTLHWIALHYTTLHLSILHYTTLHYTTQTTATTTTSLHCTTLHPLHYTNYNYKYKCNYNYNYNNTANYITLHYVSLHDTTLHRIALHYTKYNYRYNYQ